MVEGTGYQLLLEAINAFNPHLILVIAHERLFSDLTMALKGREDITLVKTPKSGGV
jgi:polyribonucleotide 5'-hydroxyl-kinase